MQNHLKETITLWHAFKKWHHALGDFWLTKIKPLNRDTDYILDLVCDTDPDIWSGTCSADPTVFEDIKAITKKMSETELSLLQGYIEIRLALSQIYTYSSEYEEAFTEAKENITFDLWLNSPI